MSWTWIISLSIIFLLCLWRRRKVMALGAVLILFGGCLNHMVIELNNHHMPVFGYGSPIKDEDHAPGNDKTVLPFFCDWIGTPDVRGSVGDVFILLVGLPMFLGGLVRET